jgi:ubiquitin-conjugating enzyme E2 variant
MDGETIKVQQQDAKELGRHYTWKKQLLEVCSVVVFSALLAVMVAKLARIDLRPHLLSIAVAFGASMMVADFISGLVHWLADTWGTVEIPILGPTLIKNFREHHSDPKALTRKGLIETNGDNCMILLPAEIGALFIPIEDGSPAWVFFYVFVLSFTFWIMVTNQVHKWAHMEEDELSAPVRFLQRVWLILPRSEHKIHHTVPFESHYAITNGWLNGPLARIGFYRFLERLGWMIFGAIPRENDIGTEAAVALAIRQGVLPAGFSPTRTVVGTRSTPTTTSQPL